MHGRRPPLASAVAGGDAVAVEPVGDLGEAAFLCALAADACDHLCWERRPPPCARCCSSRLPRLLGAFGEVALELGGRDQSRAPFGLDRRDRRDDAPVEGGEADAERLRGLLARVDEAFGQSVDIVVGRDRRRQGLGVCRRPFSRLRRCRRCAISSLRVHPYSNGEADRHLMMHMCLAGYRGE